MPVFAAFSPQAVLRTSLFEIYTQSLSSLVETELDQRLQEAHVRLLAKHAPGTHQRRVRWLGGETQVLELGAGGQPIVLIHGGLGDAFQWAPIMPALARHFHVYAVDRPGHGLADPFDYTQVDFLALGRTFLGEILDALGLNTVSIVANSMGSHWSVFYAIDAPARVSRLVLVGTPAGTKRAIPLQLRMTRWPLVGSLIRSFMSKPTRESTRDFWKQILVAHPERLDDELLDAVKRRLANTNVRVMEGDATDMPLEDQTFSAAVSLTMLHHVPSAALQDRLLAEVKRILRRRLCGY